MYKMCFIFYTKMLFWTQRANVLFSCLVSERFSCNKCLIYQVSLQFYVFDFVEFRNILLRPLSPEPSCIGQMHFYQESMSLVAEFTKHVECSMCQRNVLLFFNNLQQKYRLAIESWKTQIAHGARIGFDFCPHVPHNQMVKIQKNISLILSCLIFYLVKQAYDSC